MVLDMEKVGATEAFVHRQDEPWRWTAERYLEAWELGWFEGQRVELINGEIIQMSPMNEPHAVGTNKLHALLARRLPDVLFVRGQSPLYASVSSVPEPDIAVVDAAVVGQRPTTARLVIEVSDSTLRDDRTTKAALYASAQIAEYWILDVNARTLEVLRDPIQDAISPSGWRYGTTQVLAEDAAISPLCSPDVSFSVREMLP